MQVSPNFPKCLLFISVCGLFCRFGTIFSPRPLCTRESRSTVAVPAAPCRTPASLSSLCSFSSQQKSGCARVPSCDDNTRLRRLLSKAALFLELSARKTKQYPTKKIEGSQEKRFCFHLVGCLLHKAELSCEMSLSLGDVIYRFCAQLFYSTVRVYDAKRRTNQPAKRRQNGVTIMV